MISLSSKLFIVNVGALLFVIEVFENGWHVLVNAPLSISQGRLFAWFDTDMHDSFAEVRTLVEVIE